MNILFKCKVKTISTYIADIFVCSPNSTLLKKTDWVKVAKSLNSEDFYSGEESKKEYVLDIKKVNNKTKIPENWINSLPYIHPDFPADDDDKTIKEILSKKDIKTSRKRSIEIEIKDLEWDKKDIEEKIESLKNSLHKIK